MLVMVGKYSLILRDKSGKVKHREKGNNLVTSVGENLAADRFAAASAENPADYITLGSGTNPPLKSDTTLQTQIDASDTQGTDVITDNQVTWSFTVNGPGAGSWSVAEAGIFNDPVAVGDRWLAARFLTQPFVMQSGDVLSVTWTVEFLGVD